MIHLLCSCVDAVDKYPDVFEAFIGWLYFSLYQARSCLELNKLINLANIGAIKDGSYSTTRTNSLEVIELFTMNNINLV